jgi:predicted permease
VVAEIALATVVMVGAGLLVRTFRNVEAVNPGFDSSRVLFGRFFIEGANRGTDDVKRICAQIAERLRESKAFSGAAYSDFTPLAGTAGPYTSLGVDGYTPQTGEAMNVNRSFVSPGYFETMRVPLLEGREFRASDDEKAPRVAIVTEAFARQYYPGESPVGRAIQLWGRPYMVVGLARDGRYFSRAEAPRPFVYVPFIQNHRFSQEIYFFGRCTGTLSDAAGAMRGAAAEIAPGVGLHTVPLSEYIQVSSLPERLSASLVGALGGVSMFVAAIGLFSVISYAVSQRGQEIGIRLAMGARGTDVMAMVLRDGLRLAGIGLAAGIVAATFAARLLQGMLFGVGSADALTYVGTCAFIALVALGTTGIPALRAARIDPASALRT